MDGIGKKGMALAAMVTALNAAYAEPPKQKIMLAAPHAGSVTAPQERVIPRLDLRLPSESIGGEQAAPARSHLLFGTDPAPRADTRTAGSGHVMSPMEHLAHNFRQEGLPVAKLFQSSDSLVHLGLSPKGKPGLWVVHKLH